MSHSNFTYYVGGIVIVFTKGTLPMLYYTDTYKLHLGLHHYESMIMYIYIIKYKSLMNPHSLSVKSLP